MAENVNTDTQAESADPAGTEPEKLFTQADVDEAVKKATAGLLTQEQAQNLISQSVESRLARERKKADENARLQSMSDNEKLTFQLEKAQKELEELKQEKTRSEMTRTARGILTENGLNVPDKVLALLVTDDADSTKSNVSEFSKFIQDVQKNAVTERLKSKTPAAGASSTVTAESIKAIKDPIERQEQMKQHHELFGF